MRVNHSDIFTCGSYSSENLNERICVNLIFTSIWVAYATKDINITYTFWYLIAFPWWQIADQCWHHFQLFHISLLNLEFHTIWHIWKQSSLFENYHQQSNKLCFWISSSESHASESHALFSWHRLLIISVIALFFWQKYWINVISIQHKLIFYVFEGV